MSLQRGIYLVAAKRTPFGTFGGKLKGFSATDLAVHSAQATIADAGIDPANIQSCIIGNVAQTSHDAAYISRHVGLRSGMNQDTTALTVNRLCGSGFQAIINAAQDIILDGSEVVLAGGTESMSQAPLSVFGHKVRFGTKLGEDMKMTDTLWAALTDSYTQLPMGITAENLAKQYKISRDDTDEYGLRSQQAWGVANSNGVFKNEIAPMELKGKKGKTEQFDTDEHPRPDTTLEGMTKLPSVFQKEGTVTAGSASGICDGATTMLVASEEACAKYNLAPLARIVSYGIAGVDPTIMGIGPCPAVRQALEKSGIAQDKIDQFEVNEAFAAQYIAVERELGLPREITNVNGGAIALGHPLGASGARISGHLAHQLHDNSQKKYAVGSACIGGGQGIAIVLERS
eukprot:gb/GECG01011837.1/.p1 GENE.gb/GECG01011837.1/~~gb/GECG01011837.1/.p1  ORF type:complete len:401 (+),score=56.52 gb/GECG01011837.1/:1-1203(+)